MQRLLARYITPLVLVCLLTPVYGGSDRKITITQFDGPIEQGEFVQLFVGGIPDSELGKATVKHYPRDRTVFMPAKTWGGEPFIFFKAGRPGKYLVWVDVVLEGEKHYVETEVTVGGEPNPPDPPLPPVENPYDRPGDEWMKELQPICLSRITPDQAKVLCDFSQSLSSQIAAGAIKTTAQLHSAVNEGPGNLPVGDRTEYKAALLKFANNLIGRDSRELDVDMAGRILEWLRWATWEAGHHE